ncbi:MAG: diaminopimelate epimerase, partial [Candidatus Diapherotrites archaeon]|nr:diaminopimelate epimerase [Candidatus Diapherotrites archaeon]
EWHKAFQPHRTNAEFANIVSPKKIKMRVHERGACETAACGSGAIATVVAAINAGVADANQWVSVEMPGGSLEIKAGKQVFLRGAAQKVFVGAIEW